MARDKDQVLMFNKDELALFKSVFAENESLLYLIRKVLLQFPMTPEDTIALKKQITPEVLKLVKKRMIQEIGDDYPLTQIGDLYQTLTGDLAKNTVEEMAPLFEAKELEIDYLEQQFKVLGDLDKKDELQSILLDDMKNLKGKTPVEKYVETTARNFILGFVDPRLVLIKDLAGKKSESPEEVEKRLQRDSSK